MTDHDYGSRRRAVVFRREYAAAERADAEGCEVVSGDVFGPQRTRSLIHPLPADGQSTGSSLERRDLIKFRRFRFQPFEQRE